MHLFYTKSTINFGIDNYSGPWALPAIRQRVAMLKMDWYLDGVLIIPMPYALLAFEDLIRSFLGVPS